MTKKALVLAGGGTRGSYEAGAIKALIELNQNDWDIVTGTSIGALNALFVVCQNYDALYQMWDHVEKQDIIEGALPDNMNLNTMIKEKNQVSSFVKNYFKDKGADITPLVNRIRENYNEEKFMNSKIDYGCVAVSWPSKKPVYVTKDMIKKDGIDWFVASASAFPAFPLRYINDEPYADGGYFDNLPIDFALNLGADEVIALDLNDEPQHPNFMNRPNIHYIFPKEKTGSFLDFDQENVDRLNRLGYLDVKKEFGSYMGYKYAFERFEIPSWFSKFYVELLKLETKIKLTNELNERFKSSQVITDHILESQYKKVLSYDDVFFGLIDSLLDTIGADITHVYTYDEVKRLLVDEYKEALAKDYAMLPENKNPKELIAYKKTLDTKGIVMKMLHTNHFKEHEIISENLCLTVYPYEKALAEFMEYLLAEEL